MSEILNEIPKEENPPIIHRHSLGVCNEDGEWYWWDETWSYEYGPFETYEDAAQVLAIYCSEVLGI